MKQVDMSLKVVKRRQQEKFWRRIYISNRHCFISLRLYFFSDVVSKCVLHFNFSFISFSFFSFRLYIWSGNLSFFSFIFFLVFIYIYTYIKDTRRGGEEKKKNSKFSSDSLRIILFPYIYIMSRPIAVSALNISFKYFTRMQIKSWTLIHRCSCLSSSHVSSIWQWIFTIPICFPGKTVSTSDIAKKLYEDLMQHYDKRVEWYLSSKW